jgi:hypothetical protein
LAPITEADVYAGGGGEQGAGNDAVLRDPLAPLFDYLEQRNTQRAFEELRTGIYPATDLDDEKEWWANRWA